MKYTCIYLFFGIFLTSCATLPQLYNTIDDIADSAIKIEVDKSALQKDSDIVINVNLTNNKTPFVTK